MAALRWKFRNVTFHSTSLFRQQPHLIDQSPMESQMSKRKPETAKHAHAKMPAKAQRATQVVIRSPKNRIGDAGLTEPVSKGR
jgi:hypothetical protein